MSRPSPRKISNRWRGLALGLLTLGLLVASAPEYGLTYDEPVYSSRAFRVGEWLRLLFAAPGEGLSREVIAKYWDPGGDEQPGLQKLIAYPLTTCGAAFLPVLAAMRLGTMVQMALLVAVLYVFVANHWREAEGLVAALGLLLMPRVFADAHHLAQDVPVMAWSFIALLAAYQYAEKMPAGGLRERLLPRGTAGWWLGLTGLACGAAVASKANGLLVPLVVLPWAWLYCRRAFVPLLVSLGVLAPLVLVGTWPWLWHDTLGGLARYVGFFGKHYPVAVTYFGIVYQRAPWHFPLVMTLVTTPPVMLALAVVGMRRVRTSPPAPLHRVERGAKGEGSETPPTEAPRATPAPRATWFDWSDKQGAIVGLMVWALVVNLLPMCLPGTPKYNGVRLFLPIFPPLAMLAGVGFGMLARRLVERPGLGERERRLGMRLCLVLALLPALAATAYTHPYGMSYYNALIGGLRGAEARGMEATYWGETFLAATPWLNEKAPAGARVWISVPGFVSSMAMYQAFGLLRPDIRLTGGTEASREADLLVVVNKPTEWGPEVREVLASREALFVEELQGVPLAWVCGRTLSQGAIP